MTCRVHRYVPVLMAAGLVAQAATQPTVSTVNYAVPAITLVRQDGGRVSLPQEMDDGRPVVLNFIFTSCGSICPLMSQVFAEFQRQLGPDGARVHLMSISTDPEQDTPTRLREYAQQFGARPDGSITPAHSRRARARSGPSTCIAATR